MQKYSINIDPDKTAKAYGYELHCSPKDSMNLAYAIKGMKTADADKYYSRKTWHGNWKRWQQNKGDYNRN